MPNRPQLAEKPCRKCGNGQPELWSWSVTKLGLPKRACLACKHAYHAARKDAVNALRRAEYKAYVRTRTPEQAASDRPKARGNRRVFYQNHIEQCRAKARVTQAKRRAELRAELQRLRAFEASVRAALNPATPGDSPKRAA
jgi:hypothetical protein